ncbi:hypothetical protein CCHL11_05285 [Colletotrichum chlorophyti]|uniref:Uncharacterized protein n=1 Tax=Colletotrichum chlorophyti TaxID=708187 RepID=A0A1Q8RP09_9PEZI|nr:hypothetical protein CCHL11_05285 [Colletotrichum chlorophyti]
MASPPGQALQFNGSTESATSSVLRSQVENGRTYHSMSAGKYSFPNDADEQDRLDAVAMLTTPSTSDLQSQVWLLTLEGRLCLCPKQDGKAKRVLDAGTGTGIWAIDYAEAHPEAKVIGVDLSAIQPEWVHPNCSFELDDLEHEWTWSEPFDFIFGRVLAGSICDFQLFFDRAFANLEPGGYLEMQDFALPYRCDDGTMTKDNPIHRMSCLFLEASNRTGRRMDVAPRFKDLMRNAGFVDVVETCYKWPLNGWPKDPRLKEIGVYTQTNFDTGLEGLTLALFTRHLGWSREETLVFCAEVRRALRDRSIHAYLPIYIVYGRKPAAKPTSRGPEAVDTPQAPPASEAPPGLG